MACLVQMFTLKRLAQKYRERRKQLCSVYELGKGVYAKVQEEDIWRVLCEYRVEE